MSREHVRTIVNTAREVTPEPPRPLMRELAPADPFPAEALGDVLAPAGRAINDRVQAPLAICGQSVLAAASLAVQAHADVELPTRQLKPLTSYYLTIAATGERKTAVDSEALWPVRKREAALREKHDGECREHENSRLAWEKARDAATKAAEGDRARIKAALDAIGPTPLPPLEPLLTCPEATYEGLCKLFANGWPSLGIFASEGGQFIGGHGMSDEAKLRTAAGLSAAWDGEPIKRVRAGDGVTVLPGRRLAMHLMAQPDVASELLNDRLLADQGMLSRFLATAPDAASGTRLWREPSPESEAALRRYGARLLDILELPLPLLDGARNTLTPRMLPLSADSRRLWVGFYNHLEQRVGSGGELEQVRGLANKLPEHAARMAAVLTLVRDIHAGEVAAAEMNSGIELAQHYAAEALRLLAVSRVISVLSYNLRSDCWIGCDGPAPALASLAALAACDLDSHDSAAAPEAELIAPSPWFQGVAQPSEGEPGFEIPCAARRGRVGDQDGVFVHFCAECGRWGAYGYGVNLRAGRIGRWYCGAHRPQNTAR